MLGRRRSRSGPIRRIPWPSTALLQDAADIAAEYDGNGVRQARYTHGPGADDPLAVVRSGAHYGYHADGLGSVTKMTDSSESEVRSYTYDAFGQITSESGTLTNPYAFTGREWDASRELYYYRARSYDPAVGRFLQKDPAGMADGPNLYAYVGNNPVNRVDPSGLHFEGCYGWECSAGHDHGGGSESGGAGSAAHPAPSTGSNSGGGGSIVDKLMCTAGCIVDPEGLLAAAMAQAPWYEALTLGYSCKTCIDLLMIGHFTGWATLLAPGFRETVLVACGLCVALLIKSSICIWDCWA